MIGQQFLPNRVADGHALRKAIRLLDYWRALRVPEAVANTTKGFRYVVVQ